MGACKGKPLIQLLCVFVSALFDLQPATCVCCSRPGPGGTGCCVGQLHRLGAVLCTPGQAGVEAAVRAPHCPDTLQQRKTGGLHCLQVLARQPAQLIMYLLHCEQAVAVLQASASSAKLYMSRSHSHPQLLV